MVWISLSTFWRAILLVASQTKQKFLKFWAISETNSFSFSKYTFFIYFLFQIKNFYIKNFYNSLVPPNKPSEKYS